jgi:acyl-coenzyme A synthetase/AMP-(fatty) acid ligase
VALHARLKLQAAIRSQLNPLFKVSRVVVKDTLPRTASNKLIRRVLRGEGLPAEQAATSKL